MRELGCGVKYIVKIPNSGYHPSLVYIYMYNSDVVLQIEPQLSSGKNVMIVLMEIQEPLTSQEVKIMPLSFSLETEILIMLKQRFW